MAAPESPLTRAVEPLAAALGVFFIIASLAVAAVWGLGIGEANLRLWVPNSGLLRTLIWLLDRIDIVWITLGAAHVYLCFAAQDGLATARIWAIMILSAVIGVAWISVRTGMPLGPIEYGSQLGMKLGPVPFGLPLLWLAIILSAREAVLCYRPRWSQTRAALGVALLGFLTDLSLEPLAAKARGFWFWRAEITGAPPNFMFPLWTPLVWGLLAGLLAFVLHERDVLAAVRQRLGKSALPLLLIHGVFIAGHLGRWFRS